MNLDKKMLEYMSYGFVDSIMYDLMYDDMELANVSFNFKEYEARDYLKNIIMKTIGHNFNQKSKLFEAIDNVDYSKPVIEVSDYKEFFISLLLYIYKLSTIYDTCDFETMFWNNSGYVLKYLWLRMTPDDFNNVEEFIRKQTKILDDNSFSMFRKEKDLNYNLDDKYCVSAVDDIARGYDESVKEIKFNLSDKDEKVSLPVVRYGIYENAGKKICEIGSIQDKSFSLNREKAPNLFKSVNRFKYKLNECVDDELIKDVEPNKLLSLLLFTRLLKEKDINYIRVPSMYVLDYDFHEKADKRIKFEFTSRWDCNSVNDGVYQSYLKLIDKQDDISKTKTTDFIKLFDRLIYHINDVDVISYPMDLSSYYDFKINSYDNIRGKTIKKILK